jgi:cholesterol oxidase
VIYPDLAIAWGQDPARPQRVINAAGVAQSTCNYCGECVLGCPSMAKTTLDLTYVAVALRAGAQLRPLSEVVAIGERPSARGGGYELRYIDRRDAKGRQHTVAAPSWCSPPARSIPCACCSPPATATAA